MLQPDPELPFQPASATESPESRAATGLTAQERWQRVEDLFHRASDLPAKEQRLALIEWCGPDEEILRSVLGLLGADSAVGQLISASPEPEPSGFLTRERRVENRPPPASDRRKSETDDPWIGRTLGAYRLESLLGRGGMGVVYLGRRVSGGMEQTVAIKLMARHLRSSPAVTQFLLERETLAHLEHPHIARLLDGGVTDEGFPYVVMEFVEGARLDQACDDPSASLEQILRWMLQLCDAVAYVHRNLILHRDLKPGNVMVTRESAGTPATVKLLDFGTLKRIGPGTDSESVMTQAGMRPVTVRYASPEHILGAQVSTAADVYSLGMILYRLIAGHLPEGLDGLPIAQYLDRLKDLPVKLPNTASGTGNSRQIPEDVIDDLNAILAKALRCEPEQRYPTAASFAADLWNVISHQPVTAREGKLAYLAGKFYRRYRWPIRSAAAALAVLIIGLSAMAWQGHLAHLQELRAEKGVADERRLVHMLLSDYFEQLSLIPGSVEAQRKAVVQSMAYLDNLSRSAPNSELELDLIEGYKDMGNLLGNPYKQNLGDIPGSQQALGKAFSMAQARMNRNPNDLATLHAFVSAGYGYGETHLGNGDAVTAERILKASAIAAAKIAKNPQSTSAMLIEASGALDSLGDVYDPGRGFITANAQKAMESYTISSNYIQKCLQVDPENQLCRSGSVVDDYKFGSFLEDPDPAAAATHYEHGLQVVLQFPPDLMKTTRSHRLKNYMLSRLSLMRIRLGRVAEGMDLARQALDGFHDSIAQAELDNRARFDLVAFETDLAPELDRVGKSREALEPAKDVLSQLAVLLQRSPMNTRWQMIQAQDFMMFGRLQSKLGNRGSGKEATKHGLELILNLARKRDASPEALGFAADGLLEFRPTEAALAVEFANRAVAAYAKPMPAQLLTLAKAELAAGRKKEAAEHANGVLKALSGPVKSKIIADQIASAHRISRALLPTPSPGV